MKKFFLVAFMAITSVINAQSYTGKGDKKLQIGALIQDGGTGIVVTNDYGLGANMSFGFSASYMLNAEKGVVYNSQTLLLEEEKPDFLDRFDLKARFNAHLGSVLGMNEHMDLYPGLNLGLRNFGGHLGFRYFFTDGFGVYTETGFPIAKYDTTPGYFGDYNNQFMFQIGASFNL